MGEVDPVVEAVHRVVHRVLRIGPRKAGEHDLARVGLAVAVDVLEVDQVGRARHEDALLVAHHAARQPQVVGKERARDRRGRRRWCPRAASRGRSGSRRADSPASRRPRSGRPRRCPWPRGSARRARSRPAPPGSRARSGSSPSTVRRDKEDRPGRTGRRARGRPRGRPARRRCAPRLHRVRTTRLYPKRGRAVELSTEGTEGTGGNGENSLTQRNGATEQLRTILWALLRYSVTSFLLWIFLLRFLRFLRFLRLSADATSGFVDRDS